MDYTISKYAIFLILVFFPYVSFGTNQMDTQPWVLLFAIIFYKDFLLSRRSLRIISFFIILILTAQIIALFGSFKIELEYLLRGVSSYIIFAIVYYYQQKSLNSNFVKYQNIIFKINYFYIIIAVLQTIISPNISRFLVISSRTSETRGVTSLTPEPTMFGILLIFFCLIYLVIMNDSNRKAIRPLILLNLLSILVLAKSATASIFLLVGILLWYLVNLRSFKFFISAIIMIPFGYFAFTFLINTYLKESRLSNIYNVVLNGDFLILLTRDRSILDRSLANIFPFKASYGNYFLPGGFSLDATLKPLDIKIFDTVIYDYHTGPKIMSLWGSLIAELGVLFILLFLGYSIYLIKNYILVNEQIGRKVLFIFLMIIILGFTSFTISFPLFAFLLASLPVLKQQEISS